MFQNGNSSTGIEKSKRSMLIIEQLDKCTNTEQEYQETDNMEQQREIITAKQAKTRTEKN